MYRIYHNKASHVVAITCNFFDEQTAAKDNVQQNCESVAAIISYLKLGVVSKDSHSKFSQSSLY